MKKPEKIKICGLSTPDAVEAVIVGGATHMGMIFFEKSPRNLDLAKAAELSTQAAGRIARVAVTVNADDGYLDAIVSVTTPEMLQLHGGEPPQRVEQIKARYGLPVMKAIAVREAADLDNAKAYLGIADLFLFDAKAPEDSEVPGGNGVAFDWEIMDHWPDNVPYMLSGGLNAENVADAIEHSGATAIDVSSGVESGPGIKEPALIERFLALVATTN